MNNFQWGMQTKKEPAKGSFLYSAGEDYSSSLSM